VPFEAEATVTEDGMRALALTESVDHVSGRYRVRAFAPALASAGCRLEIQGIDRGPLARLRQLEQAADYDAVILQRKLLPAWQLSRLRRRATRLVFDYDDAVLYRDSNDPRGPDCPRRLRRFRAVVQAADEVIAGNDFLADCALQHGAAAGRVRIIPTCIDTDRYPAVPHPASSRGIDLVWIGSSSTLKGLSARRDLWDRIGRDVEGARLRLVCDRSADLGRLLVAPVPWSSKTEAAELARSDAGVSWLPHDLWSRGKCGLKVLQYQAAGIPVVANPVGVHPSMVVDGVTGHLAASPDEWVAALRMLRDEPGRRLEMGRAARLLVGRDYSVAAWSDAFVAAVAGPRPVPAPHLRPGRATVPGRSAYRHDDPCAEV
jgi:glycosyltransferase involved in cell wall biosynthesis